MNAADLAEAFGDESAEGAADTSELDAEPEESDEERETAVTADADVFFDETEDRDTRLEALRRLVRKLK